MCQAQNYNRVWFHNSMHVNLQQKYIFFITTSILNSFYDEFYIKITVIDNN